MCQGSGEAGKASASQKRSQQSAHLPDRLDKEKKPAKGGTTTPHRNRPEPKQSTAKRRKAIVVSDSDDDAFEVQRWLSKPPSHFLPFPPSVDRGCCKCRSLSQHPLQRLQRQPKRHTTVTMMTLNCRSSVMVQTVMMTLRQMMGQMRRSIGSPPSKITAGCPGWMTVFLLG